MEKSPELSVRITSVRGRSSTVSTRSGSASGGRASAGAHQTIADSADALAARDAQIVGRHREAGTQQPHEQGLLTRRAGGRVAVEHLEEVDGVGGAVAPEHVEAAEVAAMKFHGVPPGAEKIALCVVRSCSTV